MNYEKSITHQKTKQEYKSFSMRYLNKKKKKKLKDNKVGTFSAKLKIFSNFS